MVLKQSTRQNNKRKIRNVFAATFLSVLGIYAINGVYDNQDTVFSSLISSAKAAEKSQCTINSAKMNAIKQSANGFFKNIRFADAPYDTSKLAFKDSAGNDHTLAEFHGRTMLVNLWAIWCVPCRTEMPELGALKRDMSNNDFDVLAVNIDKAASPEKINKFMRDVKADNLTFYRDETMNIFNEVRRDGLALGLPITMLIDKNGCLIGSFNGSAPWDNDDAKALIKAAITQNNQAK